MNGRSSLYKHHRHPPEPTRALYLIKLVQTLSAAGHDPAQLLRHVGLSPGELEDHEASVSLERYVSIVETAISLFEIPDLGFLADEQTRLFCQYLLFGLKQT